MKTTIKQAEEIIYGDREQTYGHPSLNLAKIAKIWETIIGVPITIDQVCWAMVGVKMARASNPNVDRHIDNEIDAIGYLALIDRCHEQLSQPEFDFVEEQNRIDIQVKERLNNQIKEVVSGILYFDDGTQYNVLNKRTEQFDTYIGHGYVLKEIYDKMDKIQFVFKEYSPVEENAN